MSVDRSDWSVLHHQRSTSVDEKRKDGDEEGSTKKGYCVGTPGNCDDCGAVGSEDVNICPS